MSEIVSACHQFNDFYFKNTGRQSVYENASILKLWFVNSMIVIHISTFHLYISLIMWLCYTI